MSPWVFWLWLFLAAASLAWLVHADALVEPVRKWWEAHFAYRVEQVLVAAGKELPEVIEGQTRRERLEAVAERVELLAREEPGVLWWRVGRARRKVRPWSTVNNKIARLKSYGQAISCVWCAPVWVFGVVLVWVWVRVFDCSLDVAVWFMQPVFPPVDVWLLGLLLAWRWVYAVVALGVKRLGDDS